MMRPLPKPRTSLIGKEQDSEDSNVSANAAPLINLGNEASSLSKSDSIEFDPLKLSVGSLGGVAGNSSSSQSLTSGSSSSSSQESLSVNRLSKRPSLNRKPAFSQQTRPSVRHRTSPTPQALDASGIKDARTAFMETEQTKPPQILDHHPTKKSASNSALDQFDPLLTGQLAIDDTPKGKPGEENLLREWDLDFKTKFSQASVPPKPAFSPPVNQFAGGAMRFNQTPLYRPVTNSPFLQMQHQQQQQQQHRPFMTATHSPAFRQTSPSHMGYRPPSPQVSPQVMSLNSSPSTQQTDPFGDIFETGPPKTFPPQLTQQTPPTPQRAISMATPPKNWETFD